jgi:adenine phosphoribosyltransferase
MNLQEELVRSFRWVEGHADVWPWFSHGALFGRIVEALVAPFRDAGITRVAAIEARGFLLAGAAGIRLGVGMVAIRKEISAFPGPRTETTTEEDYRGRRLTLSMQVGLLSDVDRVLLVDDWLETGSQAVAGRALIERTGATFAGLAIVVRDGTPTDVQARLRPLHALIDTEALGPSDALPSEP